MKLIGGEWAPVLGTNESEWVAAAAAHEGAPVMIMSVKRAANGTWKALAEYRERLGTWAQPGHATRSGAMAWAEHKVEVLDGGGRA
jgi:hypothetical protein